MASSLATGYVQILPETSKIGPGISKAMGSTSTQNSAKKQGEKLGGALSGGIMGTVGKLAKGAGLVGAGVTAGKALMGGFKSAVDQQNAQASLEGLLGSAEAAADTLKRVGDVAKKSPIDASAYRDAATALGYLDVKGQDSADILGNVGKAITAAGGDSSNMDRATKALTNMVNEGKVTRQTLNQLSGAGVPVFSALADSMGVTNDELTDLISKGGVELDDVLDTLKDGSGELFQQMIEGGEKSADTFGNTWKRIKDQGKEALGKVLTPLLKGLQPVLDGVSKGIDWLTDALSGTGDAAGALAPVMDGIKSAVKAVWTWISENLIPVFKDLWTNTIHPIFNDIMKIAQRLWNDYLKPTLTNIWTVIQEQVMPTLQDLWENVVKPVFEKVGKLVKTVWDGVLHPIFNLLADILSNVVGPTVSWLWKDIVGPAFKGIGEIIKFAWNNVISPVFDFLIDTINGDSGIGHFINWLWNDVVKPAWDGIGKIIDVAWNKVIKPVFENLKEGVSRVGDAFDAAVSFIGDVWDTIKAMVAKPIKFVIETVYNNGIVAAWNKVADWIPGVDPLDPYEPEWLSQYATGGIYPGYTPGRDIGLAAVSGGEAIMRPEWTRAVGAGYVDDANAAARAGGVGGVRRFLGGFAGGGIVAGLTDWVQHFFPQMQMTSGYRAGDPGYHGMGLAADFSNAYNQNSPEMDKLASMINHAAGKDSLELIHGGGFGHNVKDGRDVGDGLAFYGADTMAQHVNHVHWAMDHVPDLPDGDEGWFSKALGAAKHAAGAVVQFLRDRVADAFDAVVNPIGDLVHSTFSGDGIEGFPGAAFDMIRDKVRGFLVGKADEEDGRGGPGDIAWNIGEGVRQWTPQIIEALAAEGFPTSDAYVNATLAQMTTESGGNPNIIQTVHDINWPNNKARGLMQVTPDTAAGLGLAELGGDIYDPVTNIRLGLRRIKSGWGGDLLGTWGHGHGYDSGGWLNPGTTMAVNKTGKPEAVLTDDQWEWIRQLINTLDDEGQHSASVLSQVGSDFATNASNAVIGGAKSWFGDALGVFGLPMPGETSWATAAKEFQSSMKKMNDENAKRKADIQERVSKNEDAGITIVNNIKVSDQMDAIRKLDQQNRKLLMQYGGARV